MVKLEVILVVDLIEIMMRSILALVLILLNTMRFVGNMWIVSVPYALRLRLIPGSVHCDKIVKFATTMTLLPKGFTSP